MSGEATCLAVRGLREPVLENLIHQWLGIRQRHDAVADVTDGRDPQLLPEHARRTSVIGDRHDRRQVAGVLLEAAQQRGQPGATTDRHDPRAAGEEPLLVDELDQRLVRIPRAERVRQDVERLPGPEHDQPDPDRTGDEAAQRVRQELERQEVEERPGEPGRREVARDLAQKVGEGDRQQQETEERDEEPAFDPDAGGEPAPEVHTRPSSRWKTATGPWSCSRSHAAISSATTIER